jgi:hypothetical protein
MTIQQGSAAVVRELAGTFDDWELACWFASPNVLLNFESPVDIVECDQPAVLQAARTDRFIAQG